MNFIKLNTIIMGIFLVLLLSACNSTRKNISKEQTNSNPLENISKGLKNEISIWMNVPYKLGGNTKEGIDCSGFVYMIYNRVYEKKVPRTSIKLFNACKKIPTHKLQEGDLVFFKLNEKEVSHVGIYLTHSQFVHASVSKGVIISSLSESYYARAFVSGGRL